ncbi:transposase IS116/IS110/IS902 family protein [mine drainage metagenome]|uniref:Transposase IS116/IS110/IS902 family protein n=1 Tax=mine drainage metagenome TaxID=410659 RepID=A0A1J5Q5I4_9ZZZZ
MEDLTRVFVDTSKQVFQLHGVNGREEPVLRRKLSRGQFLDFFAGLEPTLVGLEACGSSHHWAQQLMELGHDVRLIAPQHVKPYVRRGKNDAADAEAGCEALGRPRTRFVRVKDPQAQAALMLVSVRDRLIRQRTQLSNAIRGHAAEFGLVAAKGLDKIALLLDRVADDETLPALAKDLFAGLSDEWARLSEEIKAIEKAFLAWHRQNALSRRLATIPAVGPVGACLLVIKAPDATAFKSGRDFSAWIGLTPKDHSTGGKQRLGRITRAGDERLRATLVAGATAVIRQVRIGKSSPWPWLTQLLKKKPPKLAAVALANKLARIAWKMMISGEAYDQRRALAA